MTQNYDLYVGSETGLIKGFRIKESCWNNLTLLTDVKKEKEITSMCWSDNTNDKILTASRNQVVQEFSLKDSNITAHQRSRGTGPVKGLATIDSRHVICTESGALTVWDGDDPGLSLSVGDKVCKMRQHNENRHCVAVGGNENELKILDLEQEGQQIFLAKNVRNDWLDLRVPVWVTDMAFLPQTNNIATCTAHHQVRVYDPVAQRRPVVDVQWEEHPFTAMAARPNGHQVLVGNTHGNMALMDLRKPGKMVHVYKGFAGSIRSIQCHQERPLVATCGLDRFLRVHHIDTRHLLHKVYMKSRLNCVLFSDELSCDVTDDVMETTATSQCQAEVDSDENEELWDKMEVVEEQDKAASQPHHGEGRSNKKVKGKRKTNAAGIQETSSKRTKKEASRKRKQISDSGNESDSGVTSESEQAPAKKARTKVALKKKKSKVDRAAT